MSAVSRASARSRALWLVAAGLALTGCGSDGAGAVKADRTTPVTVASATASTSDEPASVGRSSANVQVVRLADYGFSYELPKRWMTLNAKDVLTPSMPMVKEFAPRLGMTPKQFVKTVGSAVQTWSITDEGAVDGFLENVNVVGIPRPELTDAQITLSIATLKGRPGRFEHATSPAGDVTRVPYKLALNGRKVPEVAIVVDVGDANAVITVASYSPAAAEERADQIQGSLKRLD